MQEDGGKEAEGAEGRGRANGLASGAKRGKAKKIPNVVWRRGVAQFVICVGGRQIWRSLHNRYATIALQHASEVRWKIALGSGNP